MNSSAKNALALIVVVGGTAVALALGYVGFVVVPRETSTDVWGVTMALSLGFLGLLASRRIASSIATTYNVAEVEVRGPILRGTMGFLAPPAASADESVDVIEAADSDPSVEALLVKLNTPGGQVVPSDDIRRAVESFDGPTVAYASDVCASGGYWIASAADEIHARDTSLVGSIGVIGSRFNAVEMAEKLGLSYERFAAGRYKDTGTPFREMDEEERSYMQSLIDGFYEAFVERVADGREMTEDDVRDTEAKVYLGSEAVDVGLVDDVSTPDDVTDRLEDLVGDEVSKRVFEPRRSLREQLSTGAYRSAYALGAGVASVFDDDELDVRVER
ncbi:MAG: signal peptide peptidase SppA [Halobacteriales archaeon]